MSDKIHTENIDEYGHVTDGGELSVTTFYLPCVGIINADGYLRVVSDDKGCYTETRILHQTLIDAGWIKSNFQTDTIST